MAEGLELGAPVHLGAFIQIFWDIEKERMQHPQSEGLVYCDQHDDGGWQMSPKVPFKKRQKVARDQGDMRHSAKHQSNHQKPKRIIVARAGQSIAAQCPKSE